MIENQYENQNVPLRYESNIAKLIKRAVDLFRESNLDDLAIKWDRILNNYVRKNDFR